MPPIDLDEGAYFGEAVSTAVRVHPPADWPQHEPSSVSVEDHASQLSPDHSRTSSSDHFMRGSSALPNDQGGPPSPESMRVPATRQGSILDGPTLYHRRRLSHSESTNQPTSALSQNFPIRHISQPAPHMDDYQPLQYHHQASEEIPSKSVDPRASRMTTRSLSFDPSPSADINIQADHLAPTNMRNNGRSTKTPDSGFSSTSDLSSIRLQARSPRGSPGLSPSDHARAASAHSRAPSPDSRPLSYVDLLNVLYPQPPPVSADPFDHSKLRSAVGNNASLLSTRETIEMYRANVKKTNDPAIQYEFAVFMINAAQEVTIERENLSVSAVSDKSHISTHGDLLKEARQILQRLSDRSYPFAQYYLADGYFSGLFNKGKEDYDKAFPLFIAAAKHGHAEAGYRAALCYEFGWGSRVDAAKAVQFFRQAASKNHPGAMWRLGRACLTGDMGLQKKYREGVKWLKRAAESADYQYNSAPYELGQLHETGYGDDIFKDESYAAQLFTKSADLGHPEANYRLGDAYEHGKLSCPRDPALSVHFYTGAAQRNHALAQMALCAWYMVGAEPVLEKDENEAYEWARKAAEQGLAKAQYAVGYFTEMGIGCRRDPLEANVWYVRAADQGDERAKHRIAAIRAAATGANPVTAALPTAKKGKLTSSSSSANVGVGKSAYESGCASDH